MNRLLPALVAGAMVFAYANPAWARDYDGDDDRSAEVATADFGYVYTVEVEERGETELELWATDRRGKGEGHYDAQDYKLELERGITDRFGISAYINLASHRVSGLEGEFEPVHRSFALQGVSAEFKYSLLDPENGHWGVAFYAEPGWARIEKVTGAHSREFELELKAIVQKNFFHDRLTWAANLTLEPEWERNEDVGPMVTEKELRAEVSSGLAYQLAPKWWLGAEGRYHSSYPDWMHGFHRENYAVYAGPTVHYAGGKWGFTATWQPQLFGSPHQPGSSLELEDHEKREIRIKVSREF